MTDFSILETLPSDMLLYREVFTAIVKHFMRRLGHQAALKIARQTPGLFVDVLGNVIEYNADDPLANLQALIGEYTSVCGETALTLSRQAIQSVVERNADADTRNGTSTTSPKTSNMRLLLVDDHVLVREGLAGLIDSQPDMSVIGQASSVREAIALAIKTRPDLVLMDISLPDGSGQSAAQVILGELPETKIVFLTVHDEDEHLFTAIRTGATGYLFKNTRSIELLARLRGVMRGEAAISLEVARRLMTEFARLPSPHLPDPSESHELTEREIEVVCEVARGATNREIAQRLTISTNTVRNHVRSILSKLHIHSRRDIANYAREQGLMRSS